MIYALKVDNNNRDDVFESLQQGEGRFGWSYVENADLKKMQETVKNEGWNALSNEQKDCYHDFLLQIKPDDYVVYINMPKYGHCTLAKVTEGYFWRFDNDDFNHRFKIDTNSIKTFDRNGEYVHPSLRARLKLQGKYWRIRTKNEFNDLVELLANDDDISNKKYSAETNVKFLNEYIQPHLIKIAQEVHKAHPNYDLERLLEKVFQTMPNIIDVQRLGGASDNGADLIVTYRAGLPIAGLEKDEKMVVQAKSYQGTHHDTQAVKDIIRACEYFPNINAGLIVSTATDISSELENEIENAQKMLGIPISILYGAELARFILQNNVIKAE